jgi:hypothetical protein
VRFRTLMVAPGENLRIPSHNRWHYFPQDFLSEFPDLIIESDGGYLDSQGTFGEVSYEHTGLITIANNSPNTNRLSMIVVTPRTKS